jgi:hypothetical protein
MLRHGADAMEVAMDEPALSHGWSAGEGDGGAVLPLLGGGP